MLEYSARCSNGRRCCSHNYLDGVFGFTYFGGLVWLVCLDCFYLLCSWRPRRWDLAQCVCQRLVLLASPSTGASRSTGWAWRRANLADTGGDQGRDKFLMVVYSSSGYDFERNLTKFSFMPWAVLFVDDSPWTYSSSVWFVGHPDIENWFIVTRVAVRSSTGIAMKGRKWKKKIIIVNLQTTLLIILLIKQWIQCQGIQMLSSSIAELWGHQSDTPLSRSQYQTKHISSLGRGHTPLSRAHESLFTLRPPTWAARAVLYLHRITILSLCCRYVSMYLLWLDSPLRTWAKNRNILY